MIIRILDIILKEINRFTNTKRKIWNLINDLGYLDDLKKKKFGMMVFFFLKKKKTDPRTRMLSTKNQSKTLSID